MTDTTPEPAEARIDINDAREQLLDILGDETAVCSTDAQSGVLYVIAAEDTATPATWRGYDVVRQYPAPEETDEHPDVDAEAPTVQATDDPNYDEAAQQEAERAELPESAEPYSGNPDDLAIPDLTEQEAAAFMAALEERRARPRVIYSTIDDGLGNEQVVGWDTCGKCLHHIRICECTDGPHRPSYVEKFAFTPVPERKTYEPGGDMVEDTMHAGILRGDEDDADMVITRRDEPELTTTGRRKRKDAGKPRGPRDAQATQAAAEDLAAAIKDRSNDG